MRTLINVVALLATLAMFGFSGTMLAGVVGIGSPWMALMATLFFLGLAKVAEPLYRLKLPATLEPLRAWEGALYRALAVPAFGKCLRNTPLRFLNLTVYLSRSRRDPHAIRPQVESAEACHFWAAVLLLPYIAYFALNGEWAAVGGLLLLQVAGNVYPIMHLRFVRGRLDEAIRRTTSTSRDRRSTLR